jgi:capsular polysaccharide biosynthesis protein
VTFAVPLFTLLLRLVCRTAPRVAHALLGRVSTSGAWGAGAVRRLIEGAEVTSDAAVLHVAYRARLRASTDDRATLGKLADLCVRTGMPEDAAKLYARLEPQPGSPTIRVYRSGYMDHARARRGDAYVAVLRDVLLETNHCAVFNGERVHWRESSGRNFANHPWVQSSSPDLRFFSVALPEPARSVPESFVLLGTDGGDNYSHWLSRNCLKFCLTEQHEIARSLPILVNENLQDYQQEYLDLLGIANSRLMRVRQGELLRCSELYAPTIFRGHPQMRVAIDWLRARLAHVMSAPESARERIYVSRRDSSHRVLLNEPDIEARLEALGFRVVTLSGMSVVEQIRTFSSARVIVGAHGAGLTNLIFAPPGAAVIEISNTRIRAMRDFRSIAQHMNQRYVEVVSGWYPSEQRPAVAAEAQKHDFLVDPEHVLEALDHARAI